MGSLSVKVLLIFLVKNALSFITSSIVSLVNTSSPLSTLNDLGTIPRKRQLLGVRAKILQEFKIFHGKI